MPSETTPSSSLVAIGGDVWEEDVAQGEEERELWEVVGVDAVRRKDLESRLGLAVIFTLNTSRPTTLFPISSWQRSVRSFLVTHELRQRKVM